MHIIKEVLVVWKGLDWESLLNILLKFFFTTTIKLTFITKMQFEFGQYMARAGKVPVSLPSLMK
jgi:hypothetical protein